MQKKRAHPRDVVCCGHTTHLHSAFSLVELLVTIAVVGVLATVLASAISKSRSAAATVESASNIRQIAHAISLHAQDNNGEYPVDYSNIPTEGTAYVRSGQVWYEAAGRILYPEIRASLPSGTAWMWQDTRNLNGYENTVFLSPAAEPGYNKRIASYAYNGRLTDGTRRNPTLYYDPARTVLLGDSSGRTHSLAPDTSATRLNARNGASAPFADNGLALVAYLDGRVDQVDRDSVVILNSDPNHLFWGITD